MKNRYSNKTPWLYSSSKLPALPPRLKATSDTHPLCVDWIPLESVPGSLGVTFAPGKTDSMGTLNWSRDLKKDVLALVSKGVHTVAPLIEDKELELLQIKTLVPTLESAGLRVVRHPIIDGSVPRDKAKFAAFVDGLVEEIRAGRSVVVHCRGGMGRAGTAAACVLIRLGVEPEAAMARVRKHRKGAIENRTQEDFILLFGGKVRSLKDWQLPSFVSPRQKMVYSILMDRGALTRSELHREGMKFDRTAYALAARLPAMEKMGLVERQGFDTCKVTGKRVALWAAIKSPLPVPAPKTLRVSAGKRAALASKLEAGALSPADIALVASILRGA